MYLCSRSEKSRKSIFITKKWQPLLDLEVAFPRIENKNTRIEDDFTALWNMGYRSPEQLEEITDDNKLRVIIGREPYKGYRTKLLSIYEGRLNTILYDFRTGNFPK